MQVAIIGYGAIAGYVGRALESEGAQLSMILARAGREDAAASVFGDVPVATGIGDARPDVVVDCAGHGGLSAHGLAILGNGLPLVTLSLGALADADLHARLTQAARDGGGVLHLCSGAIGGLDALRAAAIGGLDSVTYVGRKPPQGWVGSLAEEVPDLGALDGRAAVHFDGSARDAARLYPKNANVAAAVALAGIGFDATAVTLIADPEATANIHEIHAKGAFGELSFRIEGQALEGNPRSSALAAMSAVRAVLDRRDVVRF